MLGNKLDLSTVGGKIKYYRLSKRMSQKDLIKKAKINRSTIIRYENNQAIHSLDICNKIAEAIGVDPPLLYDKYLKFIVSDFGNKIKTIRESHNLTQKELGQALGVHRKTIVRWENKVDYPSREIYVLIREYL